MSWIAVAVIGGAAIGAIGSGVAANKQAGAQTNAANMQQGMFNTINEQNQPFIQAGYGATSDLRALMGEGGTPGTNVGNTGLPQGYLTQTFDPNSLNGNPAYEFALQQGGQATRNADTPGVGALSGAALKDLTNFNVGTANQYEQQYYNQFLNNQNSIYARLSGIAGLGQNSANNTGVAGTQLGIGAAQATAGAGASQAGGIVGATNALSGGANTLAGLQYLNAGQNAPNTQYVNNVAANNAAGGGGAPSAGDWFTGAPGGKVGGPVYSGMTHFTGLKKMAQGGPVTFNPYSSTGADGVTMYGSDGTTPFNPNGTPQNAIPSMNAPTTPNGQWGSQVGETVDQAYWNPAQTSALDGGLQVGANSPISYAPGSVIAPDSTTVIGNTGATSYGGLPQAPQAAQAAPPAAPSPAPLNQAVSGPQTLNNIMNGGWTGANWGENQWQGSPPGNPDPTNPSIGTGITDGGAKNGGPIYGPGTQTSDDVPTMLSNGEHVVTAAEITALGGGNNALGQQRMMRLRDMIKQGAQRA